MAESHMDFAKKLANGVKIAPSYTAGSSGGKPITPRPHSRRIVVKAKPKTI